MALGNLYLFGLPMVTRVFLILQNIVHSLYYFPENSRCNFPDSSPHRISESENLRFPFSKKNSLTWGVNEKKLNRLSKIVGNLLEKLR